MNLSGALSIVAAGLAGQFAPLRVESHGGRFTERELAMLLGKAPCILAAVLASAALVYFGVLTLSGLNLRQLWRRQV